MTPVTNARPRGASRTIGAAETTIITSSTVEGWTETVAIIGDQPFMQEIKRSLEEIDSGERLYSFEEIFGEPPSLSDDADDDED
ncbi:MAG: hypothetical protein JW895_04845 [Thermoleophilaceae bacterium]|nr:hypothetical protein [Thermoleophilaceae bacterium]